MFTSELLRTTLSLIGALLLSATCVGAAVAPAHAAASVATTTTR